MLQEMLLGLILFNIVTSDLGWGKSLPIKSANETKLGDVICFWAEK